MALVNCSECSKKISSEAKNCPYCGITVDLEKIKEKHKTNAKGCLIFAGILFILVIVGMVTSNSNDDTQINTNQPEPISIDTIKNQKEIDSLNKVYAIEEAKFKKTKAGRIQKKYPNWSKEDCINISKNKIWIGMEYDMLIYMRGKPNSINTSNYGAGNQYQCCWDNYTPSCFYMKDDNIIYSYN